MSNNLKISCLNDYGISQFAEFIRKTRSHEKLHGEQLPLPSDFLISPDLVKPLEGDTTIDIDHPGLTNRYELGEYLVKILGQNFYDKHYQNYGVWTWLALAYFPQLRGSIRREGVFTQRYEHFIPFEWFKNPFEWFPNGLKSGHRHSVRSSVEVVSRFGKNGRFFLSPRGMQYFGDAAEQLLSEQRIRSSAKLRELLFALFQDTSGFMKKGALDKIPQRHEVKKGKQGYGGIRRLTDHVLPRIKLTHDIDVMPIEMIQKVCGDEFSKISPKSKPSQSAHAE